MIKSMLVRIALLCLAAAIAAPAAAAEAQPDGLRIGWAAIDITPEGPVVLRGMFHARVSEGIMDPVTATALALESVRDGAARDWAIMVSLDLLSVSDELREAIRAEVRRRLPGLDATKVFFNATHTHTAPAFGARTLERDAKAAKEFGWEVAPQWADWGIELDAMSGVECRRFAAARIAKVVEQAWNARKPGGIAFGLGHAVVGHNRLIAYESGKSLMYGSTDRPDFSHVEGYEDHSVNLLYTFNAQRQLTGVMINVACPSQVSEPNYEISADFWHDTRKELRRRLGDPLFVLGQCSAAGDQSPHLIDRKRAREDAERRMERLSGRDRRQVIAVRIADAVVSVLPHVEPTIEDNPPFVHRVAQVELTRRMISEQDVADALEESDKFRLRYEQLRRQIERSPEIKQNSRWYKTVTAAYRRTMRGQSVKDRFALQQAQPKVPYEVHVLRIGDMAIATNPFELYLDYGMQIKHRSRAVQTFVVQLAGSGTYLPTARSVAGGAYGAVPASTEIGPEGGRDLVEQTLQLIESLWPDPAKSNRP